MAITGEELTQKLRPALDKVEVERLQHFAEFQKRQPICFIGWGITAVFGLALLMIAPEPMFGIIAAIAGGGGIWFWYTGPARAFRSGYKRELLPRIAEEFGNFSYQLKGGIAADRMRPSKILPRHHRYNHEDHFEGDFEGVGIEFNEGILKERRRSGKRTHYVTVFKGLFVMLDMNKNFEGHTIVRRDAGVFNFFGGLGSLERISLEDPEFEKQYEVYGSDQVEARYLLTPAFMERLKTLTSSIGASGMECAFYQDKLLILMKHSQAMSSTGFLEPGHLRESVHRESSIVKIADEFAAICGLVHELKLNENHRV